MELSWSELLIIGIAALIIIGPKDLPVMFRELGRFTAKIRSMGREFSRAMDAAAKESGVKDVAADLKKATSPSAMGMDAVKSAADKFEKWDPLKNAAKPSVPLTPTTLTPAPMPATPVAAAAAVGPNTAALYEKQAARKAAAATKAAAKAAEPAAAAPEVAPEPVARKPAGRVRKKAEKPQGEPA